MKVTTDGCLFGASIEPVVNGRILDIGTGTGLLALMLAQITDSAIDAIEVDNEVARQAAKNIQNSPWRDQIQVIQEGLQSFQPESEYDQIVCNPPFFKSGYKGKSETKNLAVHDDTLPMPLLARRSFELLDQNGSFWVMYPEYEMIQFESLAIIEGFSLAQKTMVYNKKDGPTFRVISKFIKHSVSSLTETELIIKASNNSYSKAFIHLLKDYYLHL
ncbi:methyltransferase [Fabibacter sp. E12]|nr:methyltransferase [Roseivirga sp. E12]